MKLLLITQKVDREDGVLGFFYRWIEEFAKYCDVVTVICLYEGTHDLPHNVRVLSLGKEEGESRIKYLKRFYRYIIKYRKDYTHVFVHMNKQYVLLAGLLWRIMGKKVIMWYNHIYGNWTSRIAGKLAHLIMYTSKFSFFSKWKKACEMPAGIDTEQFARDETIKKQHKSLLCLGRISPVKNIDVLIDALNSLDAEGCDFVLDIVGKADERDVGYYHELEKQAQPLVAKWKVNFLGEVPNYKVPEIYNKHEIYINLTNSGSMDKTILEAMSCGSLVLLSNEAFKGEIDSRLFFKEKDREDLKEKFTEIFNLSADEKNVIEKSSIKYVENKHSLIKLVNDILYHFCRFKEVSD